MKNTLLILLLSISASFQAQEVIHHYDTLFYRAGFEKAVTIHSVHNGKIIFSKRTRKGNETRTHVLFSSIDSYVDYDSTGTILLERNVLVVNISDTTKFEYKMVVDTVLVQRSIFSINPFAFLGLGVGLDYMQRFGKKKRFAFHIPLAIFTFYGNTFAMRTGLGLKFIPYNSQIMSLTMGLSTSFYVFDSGAFVATPISIGLVRNLSDRLTINFYLGAGPSYDLDFSRFGPVIPELHFGFGLKFGKSFETFNRKKIKVAI